MKNNKSAKDLAFEREKLKLQKQKREVEEKLREKDITIQFLNDKILELENIIAQKDEWIERLLEFTELTPEEVKIKIEKDKASLRALETLNTFSNLYKGIY